MLMGIALSQYKLPAGSADGNDPGDLWKHLNIQTNLCRFAGWNSNYGRELDTEQFPSMGALKL